MAQTFTRWDAADHLQNKKDMRLYLEACADEDPGDGSLIRAALNDIARAQNMSRLAREIGITREGLYKALSEKGNPSFTTVVRIASALGMRLRITVPLGGEKAYASLTQLPHRPTHNRVESRIARAEDR